MWRAQNERIIFLCLQSLILKRLHPHTRGTSQQCLAFCSHSCRGHCYQCLLKMKTHLCVWYDQIWPPPTTYARGTWCGKYAVGHDCLFLPGFVTVLVFLWMQTAACVEEDKKRYDKTNQARIWCRSSLWFHTYLSADVEQAALHITPRSLLPKGLFIYLFIFFFDNIVKNPTTL